MSRIPKWKIEKTKVKVVFRLQFQATHIPQPGWDKLFVSFVAVDSGKVIAKTSKASVRNGCCKWSDPIYETTRLLQNPKTKDFEEKLYKLVVAMGSTHSGLLGEVIINLIDFIDALKPSLVALPLHGCDFGTILHVAVQLLTSKTGFREFEQQRELSIKGIQPSFGKRIHDQNENSPTTSGAFEDIDKVNARVSFKADSMELPSVEEVGELDEYEGSAAGVDGSSYTSESLYAEKNDYSGSTELKSRVGVDAIGLTSNLSSSTEKDDHNYKHLSSQLSNDWSHGWSSDYSIDNDLTSSCDDNDKLSVRLQMAELSVLQLKSEVKSMHDISVELSSETQNLAQQLAVELSTGEKMAREVDMLKSECWKFKNELDELKSASASPHTSRRKTFSALQMKYLPVEMSFENKLVDGEVDAENYNIPCNFQTKLLRGVSLIECQADQIQNKACFGYNGHEFEHLYSEFNVLGILIQNLKLTIAQEYSAGSVSAVQTTKSRYSLISLSEQHAQVQDAGRRLPDHYYSEGIKKDEVYELLEQSEVSKTEDENLAKRMAEVETYYDELIHELEDRQKQTSDTLENLRAEHSSCFHTISTLQNQTERLREELNGELVQFAQDRRNLESFIQELEKRAVSSEMMLKRVRWNYAIAVDRLQKDLELLSFQVLSMYETNENFVKQAIADGTEQHSNEHLEKMELFHRGESFVFSDQNLQKQVSAEIELDINHIDGEHGSSARFNGILDNFSHKIAHDFSSKFENKGPTETGLSMDLDFHVNEKLITSVNSLKLHDICSATSMHAIMKERKNPSLSHSLLMDKQRPTCLLNSLNSQLPIHHSHNLENVKDIYQYPPPEYSQIANSIETIKGAYHFPTPENQILDYIVCSKEGAMFANKQLHVNSDTELSEVFMLNLQLEINAHIVLETLRDVLPEIDYLKDKVAELQMEMKHCTNDKEFLVLQLRTALDESRTLREAESNYITRYNDLVTICQKNFVKLNEALDEKNLLAQEMADCHSLIESSSVYESKYKVCIAENYDLKNLLKEEKSRSAYLQSKISSLIEELNAMKEQYENKCVLIFSLEKDATDLRGKLVDIFKWIFLFSQQVDSIFSDVSVKEDLTCENYDAIISHLEQFQQKVSYRLLELHQEKKVSKEQMEVVQCELNERESDILFMKQKFESELKVFRTQLEFSSAEIEHLRIELHKALEKLNVSKESEEWHKMENRKMLEYICTLEVELQQAADECENFCQLFFATDSVKEDFATNELGIMDLFQENKNLSSSIQSSNETPIKMKCELSTLKDILHNALAKLLWLQQGKKVAEDQRDVAQCMYNERELHTLHIKQKFESELEEVKTKLEHSQTNVQNLHIEHQVALEKLKLSKESEESHRLENRKLLEKFSNLEVELQQVTDQYEDICKKLHNLEDVKEELANTELKLTDLKQVNSELLLSIQFSNEAVTKMTYEISILNDCLQYSHDELDSERTNKEELEASITELKLQALETSQQLIVFNEQDTEFYSLKMNVVELEKDALHYGMHCKEINHEIDAKTSSLCLEVATMENNLVATFERSISADFELIFMRNQLYSIMAEFGVYEKTSKRNFKELHLKYLDVVLSLEKYIASDAELMTEKERLSTDLLSVKSTLEDLLVEKETLLFCIDANTVNNTAKSESNHANEKQCCENEMCLLENTLLNLEELDELSLMKFELDIMVLILSSKISELGTHVALFQECDNELRNLREQHNDLIEKVSEQILKSEEFKNLSNHLREFNEKAGAECDVVHERRNADGFPFAGQESLRIAFIKDQYECKVQELRSQCSFSKNYADEMLMKLQSSLNDNELRKRSEANLARRSEEMSVLLSVFDTELQTVTSEKRELIKAYDRLKAELECTILSLECCKEEKQKLQNSLKESSEDREKTRVELDLVKRLLENMAFTNGRKFESSQTDTKLIGELLEDDPDGISYMNGRVSTVLGVCSEDNVVKSGRDIASVRFEASPCWEVGDIQHASINGNPFLSVGKAGNPVERSTLLEHNATRIADIKEHFREQQKLFDGMELLQKQLQRLKVESFSSEYQMQEDHLHADLQCLHSELSQLDLVNEQLAAIFPTYKKLTGYGNSLERVLSLELELAEALQAKKKPRSYIQSSFLKEDDGDEAVIQSFKDINELIKDMIELKKRNVSAEAELEEMHGRYSQLSLQFAEVEGERQKLVMSLRNRTPKKY